MNKNTPQYREMIQAVAAGVMTRQEACDKYGVKYPTLAVWLSREGVKTPRVLSGVAAENAALITPDKADALDRAVAKVLDQGMSVYAAAKSEPLVVLETLRQRVKKLRPTVKEAGADLDVVGPVAAADDKEYAEAVDLIRRCVQDRAAAIKLFHLIRAMGM